MIRLETLSKIPDKIKSEEIMMYEQYQKAWQEFLYSIEQKVANGYMENLERAILKG